MQPPMKRVLYFLVGTTPVICEDLEVWARQPRQVMFMDVTGLNTRISTIFAGIDLSHEFLSMPLVFETCVFGGPMDGRIRRYATMEQCRLGHREMVLRVTEVERCHASNKPQ